MVAKQDVQLLESFHSETLEFRRTFASYVDGDQQAWVGEIKVRKREITDAMLEEALQREPDGVAFPPAPQTVTRARNEIDPSKLYVKRPKLHNLLDPYDRPFVGRMLAEEVDALEYLKDHPHPNIVPYHGCIVRRGYVTGIVLTRYNTMLYHRFNRDSSTFDADNFERKCRDALEHIHALGFAHNDINPTNIMLTDADEPVIIDWGSCKRFGERLLSAGTPGWVDENADTSMKEHDTSAIEKVVEWVHTKLQRNALKR